ncbi:hypothetical protein DOTSEDRAFT_80150 [Dothistroma septosporum NZE10]|uniref:Uncharacterized protein n=1 Tax=Dothistroma septosporum (strain NZE10 / CBS 128990) TaxID=675120 RepID=N1PNA9_DOTSN|nr:hypothetical protein DOTSEDRAFT_80150 [Dothistroma septosporum NZE10]
MAGQIYQRDRPGGSSKGRMYAKSDRCLPCDLHSQNAHAMASRSPHLDQAGSIWYALNRVMSSHSVDLQCHLGSAHALLLGDPVFKEKSFYPHVDKLSDSLKMILLPHIERNSAKTSDGSVLSSTSRIWRLRAREAALHGLLLRIQQEAVADKETSWLWFDGDDPPNFELITVAMPRSDLREVDFPVMPGSYWAKREAGKRRVVEKAIVLGQPKYEAAEEDEESG